MANASEHAGQDAIALKQPARPKSKRAETARPRPGGGAHLRAAIDSLDDELMVVDINLRITQANAAVTRRHGSGEGSLIGRHCYEVSHGLSEPCSTPECECPVRKVFDSGEPERVTHVHPVGGDDGSADRYIEIIATPVKDSGGRIVEVVELMRDTTEARKLEQQIVEANRTLSALNVIASALNESMDLETVLETSLGRVMEVLRVSSGAIMLLDHE